MCMYHQSLSLITLSCTTAGRMRYTPCLTTLCTLTFIIAIVSWVGRQNRSHE